MRETVCDFSHSKRNKCALDTVAKNPNSQREDSQCHRSSTGLVLDAGREKRRACFETRSALLPASGRARSLSPLRRLAWSEPPPPPGHSRAAPRASPVATSASCGFELPRRESRDVRRSRCVRGSTRAECPPPTTTWSARAIPFVALRRGPRRAHRRRRAPSPPPITRHSPRVPDRFPLRGVASSPASQPRSARSAPRPRPSISTCSCAGCRAKTRIRFTDCS